MKDLDSFTEKIRLNIISNKDKIIDNESSSIKNIVLSKIRKQNPYSSRMGGKCIVEYLNATHKFKRKTIWIKRVEQPQKFFNVLSNIYSKSEKFGINRNITKPYWYDTKLGVVAIEYFNGASILWRTFRNTLFFNKKVSDKLPSIYRNIGEWLQQYHKAMATDEYIRLSNILKQLNHSIKIQTCFNSEESKRLSSHLDSIRDKLPDIVFRLVKTHNDFTMRNIFISDSSFGIIDWDATVHKDFPDFLSVWNEISYFLINVQSLSRFYPLISKKSISDIIESFKKGYFMQNTFTENDYFRELFYIFSLRFFLGIDTDRSLPQIYYRNLQSRYINILKKSLLNGSADIL